MQLRATPSENSELSFDEVVPRATSTRRVAAAGFYHCLGTSSADILVASNDIECIIISALYERPGERKSRGAVRSFED